MASIVRKRSATTPESAPSPKRQIRASDLNVCHTSSLSADVDDANKVSNGEHERRLTWFMFPLVSELAKRVERAYVNDLEHQMERDDLSVHEQRECAEFFHGMLRNIHAYLFTEDADWGQKLLSKKPRGAWYRRWLDGNPSLLSWATLGLDDPEFRAYVLDDREQFVTHVFHDWKLCRQKEARSSELELKTRLNSVAVEDTYLFHHRVHHRADLAIRSVDKGKQPTIDWQRLQDECVLTWKYRDLPLDSHEVITWLEKRLKLATSPCDFSPLRVIRWTDAMGDACGARLSKDGTVRLWVVNAEEGRILNITWFERGIGVHMKPLTQSCSHGLWS